jgi:hypothetical protein
MHILMVVFTAALFRRIVYRKPGMSSVPGTKVTVRVSLTIYSSTRLPHTPCLRAAQVLLLGDMPCVLSTFMFGKHGMSLADAHPAFFDVHP